MTSFLSLLKNLQQQPIKQSYKYDHLISQQILKQSKLLNLYDNQNVNSSFLNYSLSNRIKAQSYIEYVPFKRKVLQIQNKLVKQIVPRKYVERFQVQKVIKQQVPIETTQRDYIAVQHLRYYVKQTIPQKTIQYIPIQKKIKKVQYIPVERKIVHIPKDLQQINNTIILEKKQETYNQFYKSIEKNPILENKIIQKGKNYSIIIQPQKKDINKNSPIKQFKIDWEQNKQYQRSQSFLNTLTKVYSQQQSTKYKIEENQKHFQKLPIFKSSLPNSNQSLLNFNKLKCKSTQTVEYLNFKSNSPIKRDRIGIY